MQNKQHDLHTFMKQISSEMASEYERIFAKTAEDPGTAGDEGEENWAQLLREWLPSGYHVRTKGRIIATDGGMSPQIDVLVLKPSYPPKLLEKKVWLAGGVAAVFECKTTLRAQHLSDSAIRCKAFKDLFTRNGSTPRGELVSPLYYGVLAHSHAWKSKGSNPADNISNNLAAAADSNVSHPADLVDMVCVADVGAWHLMLTTCYQASWADPKNTAALRHLFGGDWGVAGGIICSTFDTEHQGQSFQPVGNMIASLSMRLAWRDSEMRDLADYFRSSNLLGSGRGPQRFWPPTILSDEVRQGIMSGRVTNGVPWDEWSLTIT